MTIIGSFKKTGSEYTGDIHTLSLQAKKIRIVAVEASTNEKAPSHRVMINKIELGAAWQRKTQDGGREYLSVKLDDPTFAAPIHANLIAEDDKSENYSLVWSRPNPNGKSAN
jgi:uncharacterized protein (DUF736 family)